MLEKTLIGLSTQICMKPCMLKILTILETPDTLREITSYQDHSHGKHRNNPFPFAPQSCQQAFPHIFYVKPWYRYLYDPFKRFPNRD